MKVYLNGSVLDEEEAKVPLGDRGLSMADGLYETIRAYNGRPFALADHMERMRSGCSLLRLRVRTSPVYWLPIIREVLAANGLESQDARVKIMVTRGCGQRDDLQPHALPMEAVWTLPIDQAALDERRARGLTAKIVSSRRAPGNQIFRVKTISLAASVLSQFECSDAHVDEGIVCNTRDEVCEAVFSSVMLLKGDLLVTPEGSSPCLPSVTRKYFFDMASSKGLKAEERAVKAYELFEADEVLTVASVAEIMPIIRIDNRNIGTGQVGPMAPQLQAWYRAYVQTVTQG